MAITHSEVRRHPRWQEEQSTPAASPRFRRFTGAHLLTVVGLLILLGSIAAVLFMKR